MMLYMIIDNEKNLLSSTVYFSGNNRTLSGLKWHFQYL